MGYPMFQPWCNLLARQTGDTAETQPARKVYPEQVTEVPGGCHVLLDLHTVMLDILGP